MANVNVKAVITAEDNASKAISDIGDNIGGMAKKAGIAMAAVGVGLSAIAKKSTDFTVDLVKNTKQLSRETGIAETEASRLLFVTNRLGLSAEEVSTQFGIFSKKIAQSAKDTSGQENAFTKLGISVKDANGKIKPFNEVLLETADRFKDMPAGPEKTAAAMELFGRSGKDMIKVLDLGAKGIQELQKKADELGLSLTKDNIDSVAKYIEAQKNLADSSSALKLQIGLLTAPVLTNFNNKLNQVLTSLLQNEGALGDVTKNVVAFGGPILTATGAVVGFAGSISQLGTAAAGLVTKLLLVPGAILAFSAAAAGLTVKLSETQAKTGLFSQESIRLQAILQTSVPVMGMFLTAVSTLGGVLFQNKLTTDSLTTSNQGLKAAQEELRVSTDMLNQAKISEQGASLAVERAQRTYNEAVAQFGPDSLEAREAINNLDGAKQRLKDATDRAKDAEQQQQDKLKNSMGAAQEALRASGTAQQAAGNSESSFARAADAVGRFIGNLLNIPSKVNSPQYAGGGAGGGGGGHAIGTSFFSGGMTTVGEQGPEQVLLPRGSQIVPNNSVRDQGSTTINVSVNAGAFMGSQQDARKYAQVIANSLKDIATMQGTTVAGLLA